METDHLLKLGSDPIPGDAPCGENARYEEEYESLLSEVGKLESLHGGTVDWARVVELGCALLESKTKDLLVASYVAGGLWETDGPSGLVAGLTLCRDLIKNFWEGIFPKRLRARRTAVDWLMARIQGWMADESIAIDRGLLENGIAVLKDLQSLTEDRWEGDEPELFQAERAMTKRLDLLPGEQADEPSEPEAEAQEQETSPPAPAPSASASASAAARPNPTPAPAPVQPVAAPGSIASRTDALACLEAVAGFFEHSEPHSPIPMLVRRAVRWGGMDYRTLYAELLRHDPAGQARLWELLGLEAPAGEGAPARPIAPPQPAPQPTAVSQSSAAPAPGATARPPPRVVAPPPTRPTD